MKRQDYVPRSNLHLMPDDMPLEMIAALTPATLQMLKEVGIVTFGDLRESLAPEKEQ